MQQGGQVRDGPQRAGQDAVHLGDGDAVVGDGHAAVQTVADAGVHLPLVEHTAAAVDDQGVGERSWGNSRPEVKW